MKTFFSITLGTLTGFTLGFLSEFYQLPPHFDFMVATICISYIVYKIVKSYKKYLREYYI
jgi:hypothetical protein